MNYWECLTHACGSTNFNNLSRHEWEDCDIRKRSGKLLQNTWHNDKIGGLNGDISRKFYPSWIGRCREIEKSNLKIENWKRQANILESNVNKEVIL